MVKKRPKEYPDLERKKKGFYIVPMNALTSKGGALAGGDAEAYCAP